MRIKAVVDSYQTVVELRHVIANCASPEVSGDMKLVAAELLNDVKDYNQGTSRGVVIEAQLYELVIAGVCYRRYYQCIKDHIKNATPLGTVEIAARSEFEFLHQGMRIVGKLGDVKLCPVGIIRVTFPKTVPSGAVV
ncbi:MAG: hypothetical protein AAB881_01665 [Patescibacteria group bacterium]